MPADDARTVGVRQKDYDDARTAAPIRVRLGGEWYEYPAECPIAVAIEWIDRQATNAEALNETGSQWTLNNYKTILGEGNVEAMTKSGAPMAALDDVYADVLVWWKLWERPGETDLDDALDRLQVMVTAAVAEAVVRNPILLLVSEIREAVKKLQPEEAPDEEETADSPS